MNATTEKLWPEFAWDEPPDCHTPRGWCVITPETHPDREQTGWDYFADDLGGLNVGNYLAYISTSGPNGEKIHAVAFFLHLDPVTRRASEIRLGYSWFHTVEEAKGFIVSNVRAYLGFPREGGPHV